MNEDIKTEWVKRLRDGRPQVKGYLHTPAGQCCLGVLSEMAAEQGVIRATGFEEDHRGHMAIRYGESLASLSSEVMEWAGIDEDLGRNVYCVEGSLAYYNDNGEDFNQIADRIEKGL